MLIILPSLNLKSEMVYHNDQPKKSASRGAKGSEGSLVGYWRPEFLMIRPSLESFFLTSSALSKIRTL